MKKILVFFLLFAGIIASAQESFTYRKGYRGNVELDGSAICNKETGGYLASINTIHGYSFGNGAFAGMGIGACFSQDKVSPVMVPIIFDFKYNFLDNAISPFVELRPSFAIGMMNMSQFNVRMGGGVSFNRFSIDLAYQLCSGVKPLDNLSYRLHCLTLAVSACF